LLPWRTLLQNASLGLEIKSSINKVRNETIKHLLEQYGLAGFEQHLPNELSGGMRRRVDLVRALASEPQILFCDEPFSAIDFVTRLELNTLFKLKCKEIGVTTVVVTHNIEEAIFLGDRVAVMSNRPSRIISTHETILSVAPDDAVKSRKSPEFDELFGKIWKNLEGCYEEEH
ncbi:MAG: ABC transporter ATP-binding protein, partial [Xenococcus sp. (in: cyanobacteria)]